MKFVQLDPETWVDPKEVIGIGKAGDEDFGVCSVWLRGGGTVRVFGGPAEICELVHACEKSVRVKKEKR